MGALATNRHASDRRAGGGAATEDGIATRAGRLRRRLHLDVLEGLPQLLDSVVVLAGLAELAGVGAQQLGVGGLGRRGVLQDLLVELLLECGALLRRRHRGGEGRRGHEEGGHGGADKGACVHGVAPWSLMKVERSAGPPWSTGPASFTIRPSS